MRNFAIAISVCLGIFISSAHANDSIRLKDDVDLAVKISENPVFKKKLNMAEGNDIVVEEYYIWSYNGSSWEQGGNLYLKNDDSMGTSMGITCSLSPSDGDDYMQNAVRMDVKLTGKIKSYSTREGLMIEPCKMQRLK